MRAADNTRGIDMNRLKERSIQVQRLADTLKEKHDDMKEWYNIRNNKITDGVKRITDGFEFLRKRKQDHDFEDPGNPDPSATLEQPPATASTQIVVFQPSQLESTQGTSGGTVEEALHPITGEIIEEGEIVADLSREQLLALNEMKKIDDAAIDDIPSELETTNLENVEEIVFEGDDKKSSYMREDGAEFAPFNEEWLKKNVDVTDEQLKNRDTSENASDAFTEWRKKFLSKVSKLLLVEVQVDYLQYEKENLHGKILCWITSVHR
ncbi:hypothetical protein Hanom_Chr07g00658401 [Helianthus anomalus]